MNTTQLNAGDSIQCARSNSDNIDISRSKKDSEKESKVQTFVLKMRLIQL